MLWAKFHKKWTEKTAKTAIVSLENQYQFIPKLGRSLRW
jgi:hypothetical protein